jgi:hypothetical protein
MGSLREEFEDVADWCERHLESRRGREVGMLFGTVLRADGRLAALPDGLSDEQRAARERELDSSAETLLAALSLRFRPAFQFDSRRLDVVDSVGMRTNMIYDTGPPDRK